MRNRKTDQPEESSAVPISLNQKVWRWLLVAASGSLALGILRWSVPLESALPALLFGTAALFVWLAVVRMLLIDSRARIFWIIWLAAGFVLLVVLPGEPAVWLASASFAGIFLLFRKYRPFSYLTPRRKALLLVMALVLFFLLSFGPGSPAQPEVRMDVSPEQGETVAPVSSLPRTWGGQLSNYSLSALITFWFLSLFHLFFRIRLHFMRLRPKLAVSAFLLVLVPLILILVMGVLILYGTLGESRAIRASNLLNDWAERTREMEEFLPGLTKDYFVYAPGRGFLSRRGEIPDALSPFLEAYPRLDFSFADWDPESTAAFFHIGEGLWLICAQGRGTEELILRGGRIGRRVLDRMARILHSDIRISFSDRLNIESGEKGEIRSLNVRSQDRPQGVYGRLRAEEESGTQAESEKSLWTRSLYFGVSQIWMFTFDAGQISRQTVLIFLEGSLADIAGELAAARNPLSRFVMIVLLALAVLLLILEMFAFVFGVRITSGMLSAIRVLHRGTRQVAKGELDTRIQIPNQDELGDLAASFNEMAEAVKKGREEAVIRERLESELATARKIQERLLPHAMPDIPGFQIAGTSLPSQQVGGDYFDFLDMGQGQLGIAIGDVSGKGIPAALLMANLQASLHAQVIRPAEVAEITSRINDLLVESTDSNMFATFFYGILDQQNAVFTYTNAGHNPPWLLRADGSSEKLEAGGLLLGFMPHQEYLQNSIELKPGDVLVMYTDGITEAVDTRLENRAEHLFGEERLQAVVRKQRSGTARQVQGAVLTAISEFTGNSPQSDDITLVVIKRRPGTRAKERA